MGRSKKPERIHTVTDLEQARVLADPLRLRILECFAEEPRTTKQVADALGEPPTRLYHHVETMARAGLLELHGTRPKRGTTEKYYRAVAERFQADASLFRADGNAEPSEWAALAGALISGLSDEARRVPGDAAPEPSMLASVLGRWTPEEARRIASLAEEFVRDASGDSSSEDDSASDERRRYRLAVLFFPAE